MKRSGWVYLLTRFFLGMWLYAQLPAVQATQPLVIAAASDLRYAMTRLVARYQTLYPQDALKMVYGSSGKFHTQISNGAPFDLFFSADIVYPRMLQKQGLTASVVYPYALGRIVLWSTTRAADRLKLQDLVTDGIKKIAIANPLHAPYGQRAKEALQQAGVWEKVKSKLVYGENISHTAQLVASGAADIGIIALSLAMSPELRQLGGYTLIPARLHKPLLQGFVITSYGREHPAAKWFAAFIRSTTSQAILKSYGFVLPAGTY